jgi:hypothetical protein
VKRPEIRLFFNQQLTCKTMFGQTKAFSGYSVDDLKKARQFYGEILGIEVSQQQEMPVLHLNIYGGYEVILYEKPNHQPATFTVLNFPVTKHRRNGEGTQIERRAVRGLRLAGVQDGRRQYHARQWSYHCLVYGSCGQYPVGD